MGRAAAEAEDPWEGIVAFLEGWLALQAEDRGLKQALFSTAHGQVRVRQVREQLVPLIAGLVARAREQGSLRPDFESPDVVLIGVMVGAVVDYAQDVDPELWRRYLALLLDGMRARRDAPAPLPVDALTSEQVDAAMAAWRPRPR